MLDVFEIGEEIYRRCTEKELDNPFESMSVKEVSVNRQGHNESSLSEPGDVLFNFSVDGAANHDRKICTLKIRDVDAESLTFNKCFHQTKGEMQYTARLKLIHDPVDCMYPHCVFRVWINDEKVTDDNYKKTLGKLPELKTHLKSALAAMILRKQISQALS